MTVVRVSPNFCSNKGCQPTCNLLQRGLGARRDRLKRQGAGWPDAVPEPPFPPVGRGEFFGRQKNRLDKKGDHTLPVPINGWQDATAALAVGPRGGRQTGRGGGERKPRPRLASCHAAQGCLSVPSVLNPQGSNLCVLGNWRFALMFLLVLKINNEFLNKIIHTRK